jgi:hypothetical protein
MPQINSIVSKIKYFRALHNHWKEVIDMKGMGVWKLE